jgi:hypothetical protein
MAPRTTIAMPPPSIVARTMSRGESNAVATSQSPTIMPVSNSTGRVLPTSAPAIARDGSTANAARVTTTEKYSAAPSHAASRSAAMGAGHPVAARRATGGTILIASR